MKKPNDRIDIIDGFRGVAILGVVLFHYYTRLGQYNSSNWVSYGYYGVHLFFAISGFVICQSLEETADFATFLKHRLIRLMPCMLVCSIITYGIVRVAHSENGLPFPQPDSLLNFLPSWSFTSPELWNALLSKHDIDYIDSSYWSLWVEVIFYALAGSLYFLDREKFLTRWLFLALTASLIRIITLPVLLSGFIFIDSQFYQSTLYHVLLILNLKYWVFFSIGVIGFHFYNKSKTSRIQLVMIAFILLLELFVLSDGISSTLLFLLVIALFVAFVKRPNSVSLLATKGFVILGLISYPLYLIHQNFGLILIYSFSNASDPGYLAALIPLIVLGLVIGFSYAIHFYFERPVIRYLRSL